jgi:hypothetical protein
MIRYRLFEIWRFATTLLIMLYHFAHFAPAESLWVKNMLESFRLLLDLFFPLQVFLFFFLAFPLNTIQGYLFSVI